MDIPKISLWETKGDQMFIDHDNMVTDEILFSPLFFEVMSKRAYTVTTVEVPYV